MVSAKDDSAKDDNAMETSNFFMNLLGYIDRPDSIIPNKVLIEHRCISIDIDLQ
jgi:hypothetical protein